MNLTLHFNDYEVLELCKLVSSELPGRCCACEKPLPRNHYSIRNTGKTVIVTICPNCQEAIYVEAYRRNPAHGRTRHFQPLTPKEQRLPAPKPIKLDSIYAAPETAPPSRRSDDSKSDLFQENENV
jgi:hypothetical protein